jgi:MATE family multidrug resistance protein
MTTASPDFAAPSRGASTARPLLDEGLSLLRLAAPILFICLVNMGMSVTDTVMVSALFGAEALAAVAVGSDLYSILFYLGAGVLAGLAPLYTAAVVRADRDARLRLERSGRIAVALVAAVLVPLVWTAPNWLARVGVEPDLLSQGQGYTRAMAATLVPMLGVALYRTILTAAEKPRVFLKVTLAMLPLNAAADYLLMTGAGPLPAFGPAGAGLGSLVVAMASLGILVWIGRQGRTAAPVGVDWRGLATALRVGLPIGVATLAEVGIFLAATIFAATLGAADVAAHTLALRAAGVAYAVPTALLQAAMVRSARAEALGDPVLRRTVALSSAAIALVAGMLLAALIGSAARPLADGFFDAGAVGFAASGFAATLLLLLGAMELVGVPSAVATGLLRGRKLTRTPMRFALVGHWGIGAPVGLYLCESLEQGVVGLWLGLTVGTIVTALLTIRLLFAEGRRSPS